MKPPLPTFEEQKMREFRDTFTVPKGQITKEMMDILEIFLLNAFKEKEISLKADILKEMTEEFEKLHTASPIDKYGFGQERGIIICQEIANKILQ